MTNQQTGIHFISSPVFEFLASLYIVHNNEKIKPKKSEYELHPTLKSCLERIGSAMNLEQKKEVDIFFHYETFIGLSLIRFSFETNTHQDIEQFLVRLADTPAADLFTYLLQTGYTSKEIESINDPGEVLDFINESTIPESEKWKLTFLYVNREETKERLISLLKNYYVSIFKNELDLALEHHEESYLIIKDAGVLSSRSKALEIFPYLSKDTVLDPMTEVIFAPSFFYGHASMVSNKEGSILCLYGINQPENGQPEGWTEEKLLDALKIIGDEKRLKLMKMLSKSPFYGYELAKKLNLSNSTVSHHLSLLTSYEIVTSKRMENKVYFELNKEKVQELFEAASNLFSE
ncbi:ArsR/SmtB family transcription factor [Falsibacillus pallidus]|uniref:DNA-binding transcriptional ArsR family regulator n=1 Tax=Falsibacillus pallidus TaxID=493781 RepID=A0A370GQ02_9BACI|nr:metalloregulator ArsR/SmtB family transcription factor [Falsibacillus pallidus]RDI45757.1 DNA-binding transcriptional ArsR family regulator [Falsibacillus pallidus]